ncbi:MAG: ParB/RepB/Spo0J family partition protein, partial [bacterium]
AGERRLRACKLAGFKEIDAHIRPTPTSENKLAISLIENLQREDLNAIDQAMGYRRLMEEFHVTQTELGAYCSKSKSAVSNTLRLLELEPEIQRSIRSGTIFEGHARALLSIPDKARRLRIFHEAVSKKMSVREIEDAARGEAGLLDKSRKSTGPGKKKSPEMLDLESSLQKVLGTRVELRPGNQPQQGKLIIHYFSLEDLDRILAILRKR